MKHLAQAGQGRAGYEMGREGNEDYMHNTSHNDCVGIRTHRAITGNATYDSAVLPMLFVGELAVRLLGMALILALLWLPIEWLSS